uniref:Uncharacterized protein n=1 Tax=Anguilla anguilla TaxID=7936 RepID=A0A0E9RXC7_ANGAN
MIYFCYLPMKEPGCFTVSMLIAPHMYY